MTGIQAGRNTSILLIENDPSDRYMVRELLDEVGEMIRLDHAESLTQGVEMLEARVYDLVLLDLGLPESTGIATFEKFHERFPHVPVVVMTGLKDDEVALAAVNEGAQDYLNKGDFDARLLRRSIRYAIERNRLMQELRDASLTDSLTGLYNRRGFAALAGHQIRVASRTSHRMSLVFVDMDGLKSINDNLGHPMGDRALQELARLLQETCRSSDIVARIGGDEFAILISCDADECGEKLVGRLRAKVDDFNQAARLPFRLDVSPGAVDFEPSSQQNLEELLARADTLMYEEKRRKKAAGKE